MNTHWQNLLEQQGAKLNGDQVVGFGDSNAERQATASDHVIADLSHYGLIEAEGEEARDFLQNQFSNDLRLVTESQSQISAYCSPKGRMLAAFRIFQQGEKFYLRLPRSILEPTLKRLRMFIMRSKVTLEDASDKLASFGFAGPEAQQRLGEILDNIPTETNTVAENPGLSVIRLPDPTPRFEIHGEPDAAIALWNHLAQQATPVGADCWVWLDIQAGVPEVLPATVEAFVPQMVNLEALDGISYKKGCYPGQEVVARMHYLGKLKRRMYRAHVNTDAVPSPGDNLYSPAETDQSVGKVVEAQPNPNGGVDLLAVIQIATADSGDVRLAATEDATRLDLQDLPYTVTNEA
ncbi:MAG: folate-binding protein [Gammaproteobacteria bacterium]|nr:folate-binding protein [Gammaproteobacteria bacterium]